MRSETEHSVAEAPQSNSLSSDRSNRETNRLAKRGPRIKPLSREQEAALAAIAAGKSAVAAAIDAGVHRGTLYRWLKDDPSFSAAYHTWQSERRESARARLMALTDDAVTVVTKAIDKEDTRTALTILKSLGVLTSITPGSTDEEVHKRERELAARRKEQELSTAETMASIGE
jgi:hypothetical protein